MDFIFIVHMLALLFSFFVVGAILGAAFSRPFRETLVRFIQLARSAYNPILAPGTTPWTAEAVMNPAAIVLNDRVHLVYRAVGMDGVSRLGYASSRDGITFDERLPYPVYIAEDSRTVPASRRRYSPVMYPSGGSWGGCEDPRMVIIDGRVYVTFNMFEDWALRVGCVSLSEEDFLAKHFHAWDGPYILSPAGGRHKNWVLFPEKIGGKFAVLHSIIGDTDEKVRVEYIDDLGTLSKRTFVSPDPQQVPDRSIAWHVHVRSAGPPPLKTNRGWLVFYHANDVHEPHKYRVGALFLDLADPTKILCRAATPILSPDEHYENHGKPGIVYACGAVVRDGTLFVYYGGADKVVCVATAPLAPFLDALIEGSQTSITTVSAKTA